MDGSAPFQPWTSAGDKSPYEGGPSQCSGSVEGEGPMDEARVDRMQHLVENTLSAESRQQVSGILGQISSLGPAERLLLYLKLPSGAAGPQPDPLKQPLNPLGSRSEIHQTVMWIHTHLEVDPEISLPKQDVYDEYIEYCTHTKMKPLSTADFGKVMKQVYPCVKPRRLGTRGNSRYCYAGMRKRIKLESPHLPDLGVKQKMVEIPTVQNDLLIAASQLIREWAEKLLGIKFSNLCELAQHLVTKSCVDGGTEAALLLADALAESGEGLDGEASNQRGVIKQLKRKIQSQPHLSPSKGNITKKSRGEGGESTVTVKSEPASAPAPAYTSYHQGGQHITSHYPNLPINLSSSGQCNPPPPAPVPAPPRQHPLPGKKMILEAYNSELNSPRDFSPQARPPVSPHHAQPPMEYLPKKMRAIESFSRLLPPTYTASPDLTQSQAYPVPSVLNDSGLNLSSGPENTPRTSAMPSVFFPSDNSGLMPPTQARPMLKPKGKKGFNFSYQDCTNAGIEGIEPPRPAQRGRPRKKSLSKAKYTRRRPPAQTQQGMQPTSHEVPPLPPAPACESCCGLTDSIRGGVICAENHSEILNRERVISICSMDKDALDDYLNEGNSQEHEEELMKYLPPNVDSPLNLNYLKDVSTEDTAGVLQQARGESDSLPLQSHREPQELTIRGGDFLGSGLDASEDRNGSNDDKLSQIREIFHKSLVTSRGSSCGALEGGGGASGTGGEGGGDGFVPISPTASPFVSPRSTPRGRRPPLRPLKPPTHFPMSAPPSPNISKYRPCYEQPCPTSGVLRSFLQEPGPPPSPRPPLSAEPMCREVSQFFPDTSFTSRSQSVPLQQAGTVPIGGGGTGLAAPYSSYNNTPCNSVPPTPTPADFCDFVNLGDTCDSISKADLDPENLDKIYNALYTVGDGEGEGLGGFGQELPGSPLGLEMLALGDDARREALRRSNSADCTGTFPQATAASSRSVPTTPGERCYSNRDFLINGNSVDRSPPLAFPSEPSPQGDLLAQSLGDLGKINSQLYYDHL